MRCFDKLLWALFLAVAIIGAITWLAVFQHNYHPRIYRHNKEVAILQGGENELNFNHPRECSTSDGRVGEGTCGCGDAAVDLPTTRPYEQEQLPPGVEGALGWCIVHTQGGKRANREPSRTLRLGE